MTLKEMKIKVFSLIEEYYPELTGLAEDEDVLNKINGVVNSIQMDLMKYRKIPANTEIEIKENSNRIITLSEEISDLYQINKIVLVPEEGITNKDFTMFDDDNIEINDEFIGTVKIFYYKYPKMAKVDFEEGEDKDLYDENFKFDIDLAIQEVMPYGIARDLLRLDMISVYGTYFERTYNELKSQLDPRRTAGIITITGGDII
jgi:hypothetical protein